MQSREINLIQKISNGERLTALILGLLFLGAGIAGFIPALTTMPAAAPYENIDVPRLLFSDGYGHVFGLFATNFLHNAVHIVVGLLGIAAATSLGGSVTYNRLFVISYVAIALMGLIPATNTTFGLMPIYGHNVWLNALTALIAGYVGFVKPALLVAKEQQMGTSSPSA